MTTTYNITYNAQYDSHEVTFESKPATAVLDALKALKMRWNPKKACWYGFAKEHEILSAILNNGEGETITGEKTEGATVYTDGYLGGGAVYGSKSNLHLYGADLSKAIREDIKRAGIKGVSVRCKRYTGGQSVGVTVSLRPDEFVSLAEYIEKFEPGTCGDYGYIRTENGVHRITNREFYEASAEDQQKMRRAAAEYEYEQLTAKECSLSIYYLDDCRHLTPDAHAKIKTINEIICAYRYDESNGMVDYFDTNFYYDIYTKPAAVKPTTPDDEPSKPAKEEPVAEETAPVQPAEQAQESAETAVPDDVEEYAAKVRAEIEAEAADNGMTVEEYAANDYQPKPETVVYTLDDIGHDITVKRTEADDIFVVEFREDGKRLGNPEIYTAEAIKFCYGVNVNAAPEAQEQPENEPTHEEPTDPGRVSAGDIPTEPTLEPVAPSPIREDLARRAHEMMSYTDYREGSATAEYNALCDRARTLAEEQRKKVDPLYHGKIDALLASYVRRMADNINRRNEIGTRCPSVLVAGPANFTVKKKLKQNAASDKNMEEYNEIQGILNKIRSVGTGGISGDDPNAREKIEEKIKELEEKVKALENKAGDEDREFTTSEENRYDKLREQIEELQEEIDEIENALDFLREYTDYD